MRRFQTPRMAALLVALALVLAACAGADETEPTATDTAADIPTEPLAPATEPLTTDTETEPLTTDTETEPTGTETGAASDMDQDILGFAQENADFSQLMAAIEAAGLEEVLSDVGPLTVFAPTNEAFDSVDQETLSELMADPTQLGDILQHHVVEGEILESDLTDGATLDTLSGDQLNVTVDGDTIMVDGATVTTPATQAANGVLYGIDQVLMPPGS